MDLRETARQIHENNKAKGFWDKERNVGEMLMLVVSELSEALEADREGRYVNNAPLELITYRDEYEIWKEVDGYPDYEVSNQGNVRSLDMQVWGGKVYYTKQGKLLAPGIGGTGYNTVSLRGETQKVSILVAKAFCEGYEDGLIVNHINGVKTDDYSNNLEWITYGENNSHAIRSGLKTPYRKLTREEMVDIAFRCKNKEKHLSIQKDYPFISKSRISGISRKKEQFTEAFEFELADAVIRILDMAEGFGIDLEWHIKAKMKYNSMRPHMHGKKY